jgi:glucosamine--fructose-6-phosphate aminotransferase (isomerizing)
VKSLRKFPDSFIAEIAGQPGAIRRTARAMANQTGALGEIVRAASSGSERHPVVFTGMGASYAACRAAATLLTQAGVETQLVDASELLHFRRRILDARTILVLVSQSGRSAELVGLVESLEGQTHPFLVSVTNGPANPLSEAADAALDIDVGRERGPSTMTFAGTLMACAAVVETLQGGDPVGVVGRLQLDAARAAAAADQVIDDADGIGRALETWLGDRSHVMVLARGAGLAAADAGALILKEAARVHAEAIGAGQFRHGPLELAGPDLAVSIISTEPSTAELDRRLAADLLDAAAAVAVVGQAGFPAPPGATLIEVPASDPALGPAVAVIPLQLLAWRLSVRAGLAPGKLRIATKVTTHE